MTRVIVFLIFVAAAALAGAWLIERPGNVTIVWLGHEIKTSLTVAVAVFAISVLAVITLWASVRLIFRWPRIVAQLRRERQKRRGQLAVSRGLIAVASGDMRAAKRLSYEAERFAGDEPLALLLRAQNAQLAGDRQRADSAFREMVEHPDTRLLGLRGLYVEAQRRGDAVAGLRYAEDAARQAPSLTWAGQAVLQARCAAQDWTGALQALDASQKGGQIDKAAARRQRAVLTTAQALAAEPTDRAKARQSALAALRLVPDLIPAVALSAKLEAEAGNARKAAKLIEAAWRTNPHPDLAEVYAYLRSGDSARERLKRVQNLLRINAAGRDGAFALARAALDAKDFTVARAALLPLGGEPTQRFALLMAELEEGEHNDVGRGREWMSRALRLPRDPVWTADGVVSERWLPVSPVTGQIDAFVWKTPVEELAAPVAFDDSPAGPTPLPIAKLEPAAEPEPIAPIVEVVPPAPVKPALEVTVVPAPFVPPAPKPSTETTPPAKPRDAIIPVIHAPDDPGPEPDKQPEQNRRYPGGLT
ncbi:putative protoheme IX biogenesis protein [Variibacter gotjawalensis]|uniref:Putative protoheme IX biogenesis protein n=1 Tax=Variibacter gotjawalensis TaxID=1333996 RepID=A0A0S3PNM8_9BRAD|nr:heme biosynthesis HemY N-terminal domain-containing protein [Variibacter gotjawalensis]NIK47827.1 HemY protein [Variibacter gotjawalensis]RZS49714.1 HemY protein [Variibacter gotjawalensis]BAT57543.1 putative protoheme IX biogenesis protein [Variibacter gotjawalensis]